MNRRIHTFDVIIIILVVIAIALATDAIFHWLESLKVWLWNVTFGEFERQTTSMLDQLMH